MQIKFETLNGTVLVDCASMTDKSDVLRLLAAMQRLVERDFEALAGDGQNVLWADDGP